MKRTRPVYVGSCSLFNTLCRVFRKWAYGFPFQLSADAQAAFCATYRPYVIPAALASRAIAERGDGTDDLCSARSRIRRTRAASAARLDALLHSVEQYIRFERSNGKVLPHIGQTISSFIFRCVISPTRTRPLWRL